MRLSVEVTELFSVQFLSALACFKKEENLIQRHPNWWSLKLASNSLLAILILDGSKS